MLLHSKKGKFLLLVAFFIILSLLVLFLFSGGNFRLLKTMFDSDISGDDLLENTAALGWRGYATIAIFSMLQTLCSFMPAEPVQVLAGMAYGFPIGFACCIAGFIMGSATIFFLYRLFGNRIRKYFVSNLHLDLNKIAISTRMSLIVFLLYFLPAIPYGMICFFAASMGMRFRRYITIQVIGAIPSICIGVGLGHMTVFYSWILSLCIFVFLVIMCVILLKNRQWCFDKINALADKPPYSSKTKVRNCSPIGLGIAYVVFRVYYFFLGFRIKTENKVGKKLEGPCIVLCNHGSFIDFLYAAILLRKSYPNFVAARLYFYNKWLGSLLKLLGAFPKSMFATDLESVKNCLKVLENGGVLAMMPEARLSTAGQFEDIQPSTYSFLKKSAVPVYTICIRGDYLADPKWGKGPRRGALVEATLEPLFEAEQVKTMSVEEIQQAVEQRLYYDEFAWLQTRPKAKYRCKRMAEGLENILTICPVCGKQYTITTHKDTVSCQHCGQLTRLSNRYEFDEGFRFQNLAQWYHWQIEQIAEKIARDPDFALSSPVEFRLPSEDGKGLTRRAGKGVCTLSRQGLIYEGTRDGKNCIIQFPMAQIYRLLFGAGENFEIYKGTEILYFVPREKRSAVDWYIVSSILSDEAAKSKNKVEAI